MDLWDIKAGAWHEKLMSLASGSEGAAALKRKLGPAYEDSSRTLGPVNPYLVRRYGFHPSCQIAPFTGDNPATILALPLRPNDAMVSLGTSTTFLMSTPHYAPDPATHFFNHPTTPGLYMFMLCYKNGGLARERVRDDLNATFSTDITPSDTWSAFDETAASSPILGQRSPATDPMKLGLYFPRPEIVPNLPAGEWQYTYTPSAASSSPKLKATTEGWTRPQDDARAIVESQMLSLRLRSQRLVSSSPSSASLPPQARRIYLVGGGSRNATIARIAGEVLGGAEGVWKLDVGENACALGGAYKAVWTVERTEGESFEDLIGARWREGEFAVKVGDGYQSGVWERYGDAVRGFEAMEKEVLRMEGRV